MAETRVGTFNGYAMTFRDLKCGAVAGRGYSSSFEGEIIVIRKNWQACYGELVRRLNKSVRAGRIVR